MFVSCCFAHRRILDPWPYILRMWLFDFVIMWIVIQCLCLIAYWICTPQVPGSRPGWYGTFYRASDCWPPWQHQVERSLVCVEGRGRISRSGLTQDIKMGSCVFQCDVPHQSIVQRQVGPVSLYFYTVTGWGVMSCVCSMAFLCGSTLVKVPLLQAGTVAIWPQMLQSDVKPKQTNKQKLCLIYPLCGFMNWHH